MRRILFYLLCLLLVCTGESLSCKYHVSLSWKFKNNDLLLTCKVESLRFPVTFIGPSNVECAFCLPPSHCQSLYEHVSIQRESERSVILKVNRNTHLDGWWTCQYGESICNASVEVTINSFLAGNDKSVTNKYCILFMVSCSMFGLAFGYIFLHLVLFIANVLRINAIENQAILKTTDDMNHCLTLLCRGCNQCSLPVKKKLIAFMLIVVLVVTAVLLAKLETKLCEDYVSYIVLGIPGAVVGMICCLLLVRKDTEQDTGEKSRIATQLKERKCTSLLTINQGEPEEEYISIVNSCS